MARIRTIKPEFFKNEDLSDLSPIHRLLFIGLWTQADREGKLEDRPKRLKIEIFPYDDFDMDEGLNMLQEKGFLVRYNPGGNVNDTSTMQAPYKHGAKKYIKILTFSKHQQPNVKEAASSIPEPVFSSAPYEHGVSTVLASQEGKGKEGKGKGKEGNGITPHPDVDMVLVDKIMNFFGFNEIANQDKLRDVGAFLRCIQIGDKIEYFEKQFDAYIEYKKINDSYVHTFKNFLGSHDQLFIDGAWNAENWIAKLETEKNKINAKTHSAPEPQKGVQAALSMYERLKSKP